MFWLTHHHCAHPLVLRPPATRRHSGSESGSHAIGREAEVGSRPGDHALTIQLTHVGHLGNSFERFRISKTAAPMAKSLARDFRPPVRVVR